MQIIVCFDVQLRHVLIYPNRRLLNLLNSPLRRLTNINSYVDGTDSTGIRHDPIHSSLEYISLNAWL